MAMHTYPLVESAAFLIDHHVAAYLNLVGEKSPVIFPKTSRG